MTLVSRVLDAEPVPTLEAWVQAGGGKGLEAARTMGAEALIATMAASGLRGRGGAGFPTGTKWQTVAANLAGAGLAAVVINGAEGEPGSFKDRTLLRRNPYKVLEGALIAAIAMSADRVVVAMKASFATEIERVRTAIDELTAAGWVEGMTVDILEGPPEYLYGEETALLEVLDGRQPFPRIAPPWRQGAEDVDPAPTPAASSAPAADGDPEMPPTLVNNVETMANVPAIVIEGPDWFRSVGTEESPGTAVCTISGRTRQHGVGEVPMGTPLSAVIEAIGGGAIDGGVVAVMSGVANPLLGPDALDTPVSYEGMTAIGSGIGAAGFIVYDEASDLVAVAHGVSRFLAVESCGQCTPCKQDGLAIAERLDRLRTSEAQPDDLSVIQDRLATVADGARCYLATQHQLVVGSVLSGYPDAVTAHADGSADPADVELVAAIVDIDGGRAVLDDAQLTKQPDWSFDAEDSGQSPADRLDQRATGDADDEPPLS